MLISVVRFWINGWIKSLYIEPKFHFTYYGFSWIKDLGDFTYILFVICGLSSLFIALGYKYRISIIIFFLSFSYIELIDKTTYLNHYYFISCLSFLMCFLPLNSTYSLDNYLGNKSPTKVPKWTIDSIKFFVCIIYFYAGLAKINSDWLFKAMPLSIWLPSKYDLPIIGNSLMQQEWVHYLMSWGGMFYDLLIPFLLLNKKTRSYAFVLVVFFHVFTRVLFPIGMFPYIMIIISLIFFDNKTHHKILSYVKIITDYFRKVLSLPLPLNLILKEKKLSSNNYSLFIVLLFFLFQLLLPLRSFLYPGELFWKEQGYRFSWRVMLIEKMGYTVFKIKNSVTGSYFYVDNQDFLTPFQEKQMSFQPDFILEYAHHLGSHFEKMGHQNIEVYADSHVSLNGRRSARFINQEIDLLTQKRSLKNYSWILPFKDEINGF